MRTPVQNLISWVNEMQNSAASLTFTDNYLRMLKQMRERFEQELENEKKVIMNGYDEGYKQALRDDVSIEAGSELDEKSAEQYYNETFKL